MMRMMATSRLKISCSRADMGIWGGRILLEFGGEGLQVLGCARVQCAKSIFGIFRVNVEAHEALSAV